MDNFKSVLYDLDLLHGISMNEAEAINIGLIAYRKIGNKNYKTIEKEFIIKDYKITIPCDAIIDFVYVQNSCSKQRVPYTSIDRVLTFGVTDKPVQVVYKGEILVDGLPLITEKEKEAICTYIAYIYYRKKMPKTNELLTMTNELFVEYNELFAHARVPETISTADMDRLLDTQFSWERKSYGYLYKK